MPPSNRTELLRELKNYLIFLKDYGYQEIPQQIELNVTSNRKKPSNSLIAEDTNSFF